MSIPKHEYVMDYIENPTVYKAVMYARDMIHNGTNASIAIRKAAYRYKVDMSEVARYCGQTGGRKKSETQKTKEKKAEKKGERVEYCFWFENFETANEMAELVEAMNDTLRYWGVLPPTQMMDEFRLYVPVGEGVKVKKIKGVFNETFLTTKNFNDRTIPEMAKEIVKIKRNEKGEITWQSTIH